MKAVHIEPFNDYAGSVPRALEAAGLPEALREARRVVVKPNLVNDSPPPITFPAEAAGAIVGFVREHFDGELLIAEGCGAPEFSTTELFALHGYDALARDTGVTLVDLNEAATVENAQPGCEVFPRMQLPQLLFDAFVISAAVLKAHSLADVTLSLKNMMGCAPPRHYQQGGYWRKSAFHELMHRSVYELNLHRAPDFAFIDGAVGMPDHHLGGRTCDPPVAKLVAGYDPVAVDSAGAALLGIDPRGVEHLTLADGALGTLPDG